jgi:hypothetical protein
VVPGLTWTLIAQIVSTLEFLESTLPRKFDISYGHVSCVETWSYCIANFLLHYYTRLLTTLG